MEQNKRFEEWEEVVDCNDCSHYWDSSCDGVSKGSKKGCNSYLATRSVVLPAKINALEKRVTRLYVACFLMVIIDFLTLVVMFRG